MTKKEFISNLIILGFNEFKLDHSQSDSVNPIYETDLSKEHAIDVIFFGKLIRVDYYDILGSNNKKYIHKEYKQILRDIDSFMDKHDPKRIHS